MYKIILTEFGFTHKLDKAYNNFYHKNCKLYLPDRKYWLSGDLQLVAEALYSYGIVLSVFRISYILDVSEKFGPLQISLARYIVYYFSCTCFLKLKVLVKRISLKCF